MITEDEATRLLKRADPARLDDSSWVVDAAGYLATLRARSSNVTLIDTEPTPTRPDTSHRRLFIGLAAAAAVVVILVGTLVYAGRGHHNDPQIPAATTVAPKASGAAAAEQIAREFIEGRDTWDGAQVRALVADDAVIDDVAVATADDYLARADFDRIMKWRFLNPQCRATTDGPPAEVTCSYVLRNAWTAALGVGPYTGSSFEFVIADGQIQRVTHQFDVSRFSHEAFEVWIGWLDDYHPDDLDVMYPPDGDGPPNLTPGGLALFEQRVPEFAAVSTAIRFIEARNEWDDDTVRSLVADDAVIIHNRYTFEGVDDVHLATAEFERIAEWRYLQPQCTATMTARRPADVTCTYLMQNALSEALDQGPYRGSTFQFTVADGQIQEVTDDFEYSQYSYQVFQIFLGWLEDTHPGDGDVMFVTVDGDLVGRLTPEALALWEQRLPEFISSQSGS
jgi:hypothetical protein